MSIHNLLRRRALDLLMFAQTNSTSYSTLLRLTLQQVQCAFIFNLFDGVVFGHSNFLHGAFLLGFGGGNPRTVTMLAWTLTYWFPYTPPYYDE